MKTSSMIPLMALVLGACATQTEREKPAGEKEGDATRIGRVAVATVAGPDGKVLGSTVFVEGPNAVHVYATVEGLTPGAHGFHVHENGECEGPTYESAGGHFAPEGHPHGGPNDPKKHAGDFGNIEAGVDGKAKYYATSTSISLDPADQRSVVGKAVIVHEGKDDLKSQPSGAAGGRLGCGLVELVEARTGT